MRVKGYTIAPFDKKMERQDGALGRHFDGKDERTLLQNAKEREQSVESRSNAMPSNACILQHPKTGRSDARRRARHVVQMQRSESRAESSLSGYAERRMHSKKVKCKTRGARTEREKLVLSPLGLTFPQNRVLSPFWARFSLGVVVCTAEGANGDSEAIL